MVSFPQRFKELLAIKEIKQKDVVDKTGLTRSTVSMYATGSREPRQDKVTIIAEAYNVNPDWLMGFDVPMNKRNSKEDAEQHFKIICEYEKLSEENKSKLIEYAKFLTQQQKEK